MLGQAQMPAFFAACDLLVVPSLNSTKRSAWCKVEAMLCGTPSIASDLPGVRQPAAHDRHGPRWCPSATIVCLAEASFASSGTAATRSATPADRGRHSAWSAPWAAMRRSSKSSRQPGTSGESLGDERPAVRSVLLLGCSVSLATLGQFYFFRRRDYLWAVRLVRRWP